MFFAPEIFWDVPPEILDRHYKIGPSTDCKIQNPAKFHAGRPTHLGDFAREKKFKKTSRVKHKSFRKLSFSGGLKRTGRIVSHGVRNVNKIYYDVLR